MYKGTMIDQIMASVQRAEEHVDEDVARRHPRLNLLNLEAVAAAGVLEGIVWLSETASGGVLPPVLDAKLKAAGADYYVRSSGTLQIGPDKVLIRLVTSFATGDEEIDRFVNLCRL